MLLVVLCYTTFRLLQISVDFFKGSKLSFDHFNNFVEEDVAAQLLSHAL